MLAGALVLAAALSACGPADQPPVLAADEVRFVAGGIELHLPPQQRWSRLTLADGRGAALLTQPLVPGAPALLRFDYRWHPGEALRLLPDGGEAGALAVSAPLRLPAPVAVRLQVPEGMDLPPGGTPLLLPRGAQGHLALVLTNTSAAPLRVSARVRLPPGWEAGRAARPAAAQRRVQPGEALVLRWPFRVGPARGHQELVWQVAVPGLKQPLQGGQALSSLPPAEMAAALQVLESRFSADALGTPATDRPRETVLVEPPWLTRGLDVLGLRSPRDPFQPVGYSRWEIRNRLPAETVLVLRSWVAAEPDGPPLPAFGDPGRASGSVLTQARVAADATAVLAVPLYVLAPPAGLVQRCVALSPWGMALAPRSTVLAPGSTALAHRGLQSASPGAAGAVQGTVHCRPLRVSSTPLPGWLALWLAAAASVAVLILGLARSGRWLGRFTQRELVLAALTFSLTLLAVSLPSLVVNAAASLLLGPLLFVVEGLFYKGLLYVLLGALFVWLPRPGVYALFYALWMTAQALLSGHYSPPVLLFAGVAVTVVESALWLSGLTRRGAPARVLMPAVLLPAVLMPAVLLPALLIGLAEALVVYWDLLLLRLLYRQYLAEGYLLLQAASAGLYAGGGLALGLRLGRSLLPLRRPEPARYGLAAPFAGSAPLPAPEPGGLRVSALRFAFPGAEQPTLREVSFALVPGEIVLLAGASGSGKTTLLRLIQGLLPLEDRGAVTWGGVPRDRFSAPAWARRCALLFQEPALQVLRPTVAGEIQLGLDCAAPPPAVPPPSVSPPPAPLSSAPHRAGPERAPGGALQQALAEFRLQGLENRSTARLSGGELQRTALAALTAGRPPLLLLDEPLAHLDGPGRTLLLSILRERARSGCAVLLAEHRLRTVLPAVDRVLWLKDGRIAWQGPAASAPRELLGGAPWPPPQDAPGPAAPPRIRAAPGLPVLPVLEARGVRFRYRGQPRDIFRDLAARVLPGQAVAVVGANGTGKSTLLQLLLGLRKPAAGELLLEGRRVHRLGWARRSALLGYVPQQSDLILHAPTVAEELALALRWRGAAPQAIGRAVQAWLERLGLEREAARFPHLLSRGERQRLALGAVLIAGPQVLVLDEPWVGQDAAQRRALTALCREFLAGQPRRCLMFSTHDGDDVPGLADVQWRLEAEPGQPARLAEESAPLGSPERASTQPARGQPVDGGAVLPLPVPGAAPLAVPGTERAGAITPAEVP